MIVPQTFDQSYFAHRAYHLGIGSAHPVSDPTAGSLTAALRHALDPRVAKTANALAGQVRTDGALTAARRLIEKVAVLAG